MTSSPSAGFAVERLRPHTLDHFRYWASLTTLDNGEPWELQGFQEDIVEDIFAGYREIVVVLPTGNAKTTLIAGFAVYHCQFVEGASVPIGASAMKQAGVLYRQAAGFVRRSKWLKQRFKVQDGYKRIVGLQTGSMIEVYSASDDTGDGIIPSLALIDELHRHKGHDLYGTWRDKLTKRDGQLIAISTAGDDESNPLEQLRDDALKMPNVEQREGRHMVARSEGREFVMHQWALRPGDDPDDLKLVKLANPLEQVTVDELRMRRDSPSTKRWHWLRFTCNVRSKGEESAIQPEEWDALGEKDLKAQKSAPTYGWVDLGWKIDHAAIGALIWEGHERRVITSVTTLPPPVDESDIVAAFLRLQIDYPELRGIVYDPNAGGQQMVQLLEKGEHPLQTGDDLRAQHGLPPLAEVDGDPLVFIEHSQDNAPMSLAAARLEEAMRQGWLIHDMLAACTDSMCRCGGLRGHVLNAVTRSLGGEKWKFDRPSDAKGEKRKKYPVDALTGVLIGHNAAVGELDAIPKPKPRFQVLI